MTSELECLEPFIEGDSVVYETGLCVFEDVSSLPIEHDFFAADFLIFGLSALKSVYSLERTFFNVQVVARPSVLLADRGRQFQVTLVLKNAPHLKDNKVAYYLYPEELESFQRDVISMMIGYRHNVVSLQSWCFDEAIRYEPKKLSGMRKSEGMKLTEIADEVVKPFGVSQEKDMSSEEEDSSTASDVSFEVEEGLEDVARELGLN